MTEKTEWFVVNDPQNWLGKRGEDVDYPNLDSGENLTSVLAVSGPSLSLSLTHVLHYRIGTFR